MKRLAMVVGIVCLVAQAGFCIQWPVGSPENYQYGYLFAEQTASGRHLGVDIILTPGTEIKAPCDATIVIAKIDSTTVVDPSQGYGLYIVAEYTAPTGEIRTFGFGHLSHRPEYPYHDLGYISEGDTLGYVGFDDENGMGGPHTHWFDYGAPYDGIYHYYGYAPNPAGDDVDYDINGNYVGGKFTNPIVLWEDFFSYLQSTTFNYPDFTSVAGLTLVSPAAQYGSVLRLTSNLQWQKGAAWFAEKQYIAQGFETTFEFQISDLGQTGADGIAFVIQDAGDAKLGEYGGGMGYMNIPKSLAVEFDTWQNWGGDAGFPITEVNDNHVSIQSLGTQPNLPGSSATLAENAAIPPLSDGQIHLVKIAYVMPGELLVFLDDLFWPVLTVPVNLASLLQLSDGSAWVGFTSATGAAYENHDILSWSFATNGVLPKPDLTARLAVSPAVLRVGGTATVSGMVDNGPEADAAACQVTVSFGSQAKTVDLPVILTGGSAPFSVTFNLTTVGTQTVTVFADSGNTVAEGDEGNNITEIEVTVLPPLLPDLTVSSINVSKQKGKLIVQVGMSNIGNAPAGSFRLRLEVLETGEIQTASFTGLAAGANTIQNFTLKKAPRRTITLRAAVDCDSQISESDETNNLLVVSQPI